MRSHGRELVSSSPELFTLEYSTHAASIWPPGEISFMEELNELEKHTPRIMPESWVPCRPEPGPPIVGEFR